MGVRRIRRDEAGLLRQARLAALLDSPAAFATSYAQSTLEPESHWVDRARRSSVGGKEAIFFGEEADRVVGMVGVYTPAGRRSHRHLYGLWVDPRHRRRGVGRHLVEAVVDFARGAGAERVDLWVVEGNEPAGRLYESLGFEPTGNRKPLPSASEVTEMELALRLGKP